MRSWKQRLLHINRCPRRGHPVALAFRTHGAEQPHMELETVPQTLQVILVARVAPETCCLVLLEQVGVRLVRCWSWLCLHTGVNAMPLVLHRGCWCQCGCHVPHTMCELVYDVRMYAMCNV